MRRRGLLWVVLIGVVRTARRGDAALIGTSITVSRNVRHNQVNITTRRDDGQRIRTTQASD